MVQKELERRPGGEAKAKEIKKRPSPGLCLPEMCLLGENPILLCPPARLSFLRPQRRVPIGSRLS
jgi:hypothetical protein